MPNRRSVLVSVAAVATNLDVGDEHGAPGLELDLQLLDLLRRELFLFAAMRFGAV